jgi:RNA polymerase sigma factor (sigma-70 family)
MTDLELVTVFQTNHNARAYSELYNRYYSKVERYCLKSFSDLQNAKDAAQDVFLKVFEKLATLKKPELWVAWLFSITRNVVLNIHKKNARSRMENVDEFPAIADDDSEIEALQEKERKLTALSQLLETPDGLILKMKYVEGLSIKQLSHDMHLKESAVKMRLLRARHHIVEMYEQRYANRA